MAEVQLPQLGESVTEGIITAWLVNPGDTVAVDQPIVEVSTDKVDTEIPSPIAGVVTELRASVDDTVLVGQVIAIITADDNAPAPAAPAAAPAAAKPAPAPAPAAAPAAAKPAAAPAAAPKAQPKAGGHRRERRGHVILRFGDVGRVGGTDAVDRALVDQHALRVDHIHVRRDLGTIETAHITGLITEIGRRGRAGLLHPRPHFLLGEIALGPWFARVDHQPNNAFRGRLFLQRGHVAAALVMLHHEGAFLIHPLQYHGFAVEVAERVALALNRGQGEIRRRLPDLGLGGQSDGGERGQTGRGEEETQGVFHRERHGASTLAIMCHKSTYSGRFFPRYDRLRSTVLHATVRPCKTIWSKSPSAESCPPPTGVPCSWATMTKPL